jgi:uncharacterized membrane protein YvlD (DUF360 family)
MESGLTENQKLECQTLIEEYKRLNDEILKRIDFFDKNINYQFILLGIVVSAISAILTKGNDILKPIHYILLTAPLVFYFLSFYNSINNMYTFKIAHYISDNIRTRLSQLLETDQILNYDNYIQQKIFQTAKKKNRLVTFIVLQWTLLIPVSLIIGYLFLINAETKYLMNKEELLLLIPNTILFIASFIINSKQFKIISEHKNR